MNADEGDPQPPEQVRQLWACVQKALEANNNPTPREIDRCAAVAGEKLAATTIDGWFKTWSVVPTWDRFNALVKALAAEEDEDWKKLHEEALIADRRHKKGQRRNSSTDVHQPTQSTSQATDIQTDPQPADDPDDTGTKDSSRSLHRVRWTIVVPVFIAVVTLLMLGIFLIPSEPEPSANNPHGGAPYPDSQSESPTVHYCTYVIKEPAEVYAAPDTSSPVIKFKYLNEKIRTVNRQHPPNWIAVRTPQNAPGFNWMETSTLAPLMPCQP